MTSRLLSFCFPFSLFALTALVSCDSKNQPEQAKTDSEQPIVDFVTDVKPILQEHCVRCHNEKSLFGGLNLTTKAMAMRGSDTGAIIVSGYPDKSLILTALSLEHGEKAMPATGPKLSDEEKETLRLWIEQGAEWPDGEEGSVPPVEVDVKSV
ncbi:MAG: hypothetical protein CMO55_06070 [Verrucomicrobiales bacterium]|nr:hypothetical protein [Verrucomicrobiales bacterium]